MKNGIRVAKQYGHKLFYASIFLFTSTVLVENAYAQKRSALPADFATCIIKRDHKDPLTGAKAKTNFTKFESKTNHIGNFNRVSNIQPKERVPIEIAYPEGSVGDKIVISAVDGGKLDNGQGVKVMKLNSQKKVAFTFQVTTDPGIYRIALSKGHDTKIVQLWVGSEEAPDKIK